MIKNLIENISKILIRKTEVEKVLKVERWRKMVDNGNRLRNRSKRKKGFTLLEMIFTLFLIGIFLSIFLPGYLKTRTDEILANRVVFDLVMRRDALKWYCFTKGNFPTNWNDLKTAGFLPASLPDSGPLGNYELNVSASGNYVEIVVRNVTDSFYRNYLSASLPVYFVGSDMHLRINRPGIEAALNSLRRELEARDVQFYSIVDPDTNVPKPSCPADRPNPKIYTAPIFFRAYDSATDSAFLIAGVTTYAEDNGNYWTVRAYVRGSDNNLYSTNNIKVEVFTFCSN